MPRQERPRSWQLCSHLVRYPTKSLFAAAKRAALRGHFSMKSIATVTNAFNEAAGNSFSMNKRRSAPETCRDIHKSSSSITGDHLHVAFRALPYHCMRSCKILEGGIETFFCRYTRTSSIEWCIERILC